MVNNPNGTTTSTGKVTVDHPDTKEKVRGDLTDRERVRNREKDGHTDNVRRVRDNKMAKFREKDVPTGRERKVRVRQKERGDLIDREKKDRVRDKVREVLTDREKRASLTGDPEARVTSRDKANASLTGQGMKARDSSRVRDKSREKDEPNLTHPVVKAKASEDSTLPEVKVSIKVTDLGTTGTRVTGDQRGLKETASGVNKEVVPGLPETSTLDSRAEHLNLCGSLNRKLKTSD